MSIQLALQANELFSDLSDRTLSAIAGLAQQRHYDEGDKIYEFGDDALEVFLLDSGRVRFGIGVGNRDGGLSIMTKGQAFGWASLLEQRPRRNTTAICLEDCSLYVISAQALLELLNRDVAAGYRVMRRLATMIARDFMAVLAV